MIPVSDEWQKPDRSMGGFPQIILFTLEIFKIRRCDADERAPTTKKTARIAAVRELPQTSIVNAIIAGSPCVKLCCSKPFQHLSNLQGNFKGNNTATKKWLTKNSVFTVM